MATCTCTNPANTNVGYGGHMETTQYDETMHMHMHTHTRLAKVVIAAAAVPRV